MTMEPIMIIERPIETDSQFKMKNRRANSTVQ